MNPFNFLTRLFLRLRYPVSLPEEIASALGIHLSNSVRFDELLRQLCSPSCKPTKLARFMPRDKAEAAFGSARRRERFQRNTLCSYYFTEGWLEFVLQFDDQSRLRRIYLQHKRIHSDHGIEIPLR